MKMNNIWQKDFWQKNALLVIMAAYFIMASAGIFFNYSLFNTTGDEAPLLSAALKMIAGHSLRPNYPSFYHLSLGAYLYLPFFAIALFIMRLSGLFPSLAALERFGQVEFAKFLPLGRFISVLAGLACLYFLYRISKKLFNNKLVSLLSVFLLSSSLLFIQASHFARVWLPQTLTVLLALYMIIDFYQAPSAKIKHYLWCGLSIGLAFGTHVVGIFAYVSFLAAHYLKNKKEKIKNIIINPYFWSANLIFTVVYLIVYFLNTYGFIHYLGGLFPNPNKMLNLSETFSPLVDRSAPLVPDGSNTISKSIFYYLGALWQSDPLLLTGALFGSVVMFFKKRDIFLILASFVFVYFFAISSISIKIARYLLPILPVLALFSAFGLSWFYQRTSRKKAAALLIAVLCLLSLYPPLLWDYKFLLPSSRLEAVNWIYNNLPAGENIINFDGHLELNENRQTIKDMTAHTSFATKKRLYLLSQPDDALPKPNYYVLSFPHYNEIPKEIFDKKYDYLVISWLNKDDLQYWKGKLEEVNLNLSSLSLVKRFPAGATEDDIGMDLGGAIDNPLVKLPKLRQNGPIVDIYKLDYAK
ncbi:MAG: glycosyltransferase family 39 protein [Patescibacteria group bacterium]|jgi:4-amino-4-deoxy-L-arabinose transferase-like glycosyltransferase